MPFEFRDTALQGVKIIQSQIFGDTRVFFMGTYKK